VCDEEPAVARRVGAGVAPHGVELVVGVDVDLLAPRQVEHLGEERPLTRQALRGIEDGQACRRHAGEPALGQLPDEADRDTDVVLLPAHIARSGVRQRLGHRPDRRVEAPPLGPVEQRIAGPVGVDGAELGLDAVQVAAPVVDVAAAVLAVEAIAGVGDPPI